MELTTFRTVPVPSSISPASAAKLAALIAEALSDGSVRGLVLEGETQSFCLGMDIAAFGRTDPAHGVVDPEIGHGIRRFADTLGLLASAPKPTLAVVAGPALGGGLGLAAACDLVVATRTATFGLPEGLFGLAPAVIAPVLLDRITVAALRRLTLTAETIAADEAKAIGLVDEVVDSQAMTARVQRLCTALSRVHPRTKSALGDAIHERLPGTLASSMQWGVTQTTRAGQSPEVVERIRRFLEGGAPWST